MYEGDFFKKPNSKPKLKQIVERIQSFASPKLFLTLLTIAMLNSELPAQATGMSTSIADIGLTSGPPMIDIPNPTGKEGTEYTEANGPPPIVDIFTVSSETTNQPQTINQPPEMVTIVSGDDRFRGTDRKIAQRFFQLHPSFDMENIYGVYETEYQRDNALEAAKKFDDSSQWDIETISGTTDGDPGDEKKFFIVFKK